MFGLEVTGSCKVPQHQGSRESAGTWAGQSPKDGKYSRPYAKYLLDSSRPSHFFSSKHRPTSFIDFILNWHHVFPTSLVVYCIPTPVIRGQVGHRIRGGVLSGRSLNRGGLLVHPLHVCASILPVSESPSSTSSRSCYHRVLQEKTTAPSTESSVSPTSIKETCQYEPPSPQTPPPTTTIMIPGLITSPTVMVSADRQQVIETNRSLRNIKNVRPPLSLTCPSPYRH